jgi:predicted RNA-binding Zn-ribbon protein involved in translation (DUF1610 family)
MPDPAPSLLAAFLVEQDHPCPQCGYNLRNLQGTRCPECGEELVLRVNVAETRQKLLITGLIGLSAGAGLNGLLLIYGVIQIIRDRWYYGDQRFFYTCGIGLLFEGGAMFLWLRTWRAARRLPMSARLALAAGCWLLTLIDLVIFSFTIK